MSCLATTEPAFSKDGLLEPGIYLLQHKEDEQPAHLCAVAGRDGYRMQTIGIIDNLSPMGQSQDLSDYTVVTLLHDFVPR